MSSLLLKRKCSETSHQSSQRASRRPGKNISAKRGRYCTHTYADLDLVSTFNRIDDFKESNGKSGVSISKTALKVKIPRQTLSHWSNRWVNLGRPENFQLKNESHGRPTSLTSNEEKKLDQILLEKYFKRNEILVNETISVEALALVNSNRSRNCFLHFANRTQTSIASQFWARSFRKRLRPSVRTQSRTHISTVTNDRMDQTIDYIVLMHVAIAKYRKMLTFGADETPLRSVAQNRTTIARMWTESVKIRKVANEKQQLTAMLAISVSGDKLKPMIIHKGRIERCLINFDLRNDILGAYSKNGWINGQLMIQFLQNSVLPHAQGKPCALSLDDFDAHWTSKVQAFADANHIKLIRVPPGITGDYQSLDVRVNGILKMRQVAMQRSERIENTDRKFNLHNAVRDFKSGWAKATSRDIKSSWSPMMFRENHIKIYFRIESGQECRLTCLQKHATLIKNHK